MWNHFSITLRVVKRSSHVLYWSDLETPRGLDLLSKESMVGAINMEYESIEFENGEIKKQSVELKVGN